MNKGKLTRYSTSVAEFFRKVAEGDAVIASGAQFTVNLFESPEQRHFYFHPSVICRNVVVPCYQWGHVPGVGDTALVPGIHYGIASIFVAAELRYFLVINNHSPSSQTVAYEVYQIKGL